MCLVSRIFERRPLLNDIYLHTNQLLLVLVQVVVDSGHDCDMAWD
jgi:hypothetical protein